MPGDGPKLFQAQLVSSIRRTSTGGIDMNMRVAAFLSPEDLRDVGVSQEQDLNRAVALYDYTVALDPPEEGDDQWLQLPRKV